MIHEGKTVIVTGGASGIGRGIVERFAREGANVVVADIDEGRAAEVVAACRGRAIFQRTDVTDEASVDGCVAEAVRRFGGLDVMVNNAGIIFVAPLVESTLADWRRIMDVNVIGVYLGSRAAARQLIAQGRGGVIVNASSGAGRRGSPNLAHYCASKAAIIMLSQSLAIELAPHQIRVNCYTPGHIETPFWEGIAAGFGRLTGQTTEEVIAGFRAGVPAGRFGTPDDVAAAVSWLATDDAAYMSGQCLAMNGAQLPY